MITIVDYGSGNLWSVQNGLKHVGAEARISGDPDVVARSHAVVFPGVGAFRDCMQNLAERGLRDKLKRYEHHMSHAANAYYCSGYDRA